MSHLVADPVPPQPPRLVATLPKDRALLSDEEWQALLWAVEPVTTVPLQAQTGAAS